MNRRLLFSMAGPNIKELRWCWGPTHSKSFQVHLDDSNGRQGKLWHVFHGSKSVGIKITLPRSKCWTTSIPWQLPLQSWSRAAGRLTSSFALAALIKLLYKPIRDVKQYEQQVFVVHFSFPPLSQNNKCKQSERDWRMWRPYSLNHFCVDLCFVYCWRQKCVVASLLWQDSFKPFEFSFRRSVLLVLVDLRNAASS